MLYHYSSSTSSMAQMYILVYIFIPRKEYVTTRIKWNQFFFIDPIGYHKVYLSWLWKIMQVCGAKLCKKFDFDWVYVCLFFLICKNGWTWDLDMERILISISDKVDQSDFHKFYFIQFFVAQPLNLWLVNTDRSQFKGH